MDYKEAKLLLDKFYDARTTCLEEQHLYEWLSSDECPKAYFADRETVQTYVQQHSSVEIPDKLELKMQQFVDQWDNFESRSVSKKIDQSWKFVAGIAAIIALVAGMSICLHPSSQGVYIDTCETPEEAYIEYQKVLSLASETIQKGMSPIIEQYQNGKE